MSIDKEGETYKLLQFYLLPQKISSCRNNLKQVSSSFMQMEEKEEEEEEEVEKEKEEISTLESEMKLNF